MYLGQPFIGNAELTLNPRPDERIRPCFFGDREYVRSVEVSIKEKAYSQPEYPSDTGAASCLK